MPPLETLKHSSGSVSVGSLGPGVQGSFEPSEHLWQVWGLILNMISPLLPSCWLEIQQVPSEGDQPWDFFGRNDAKAETPVLWPPHVKS